MSDIIVAAVRCSSLHGKEYRYEPKEKKALQLRTFRVINCFGFGDSGSVDLSDENNLIYVLGRNSSGKSCLLTAIKYFGLGTVPESHPKFKNFDPTTEEPTLIAEFSLEQGDLSFSHLMNQVYERIQRAEVQPELSPEVVRNAPELEPLYAEITNTYQTLIEQLTTNKKVWIRKTATGNYRFLASPSDDSYEGRQQRLGQLLTDVLGGPNESKLIGNMGANVTIPPTEIENYLFLQFPNIIAFDEGYPLATDLPNNITKDTLSQEGQNRLLDALISLLGRDTITKYLDSPNPNTLDALEEEMQQKANRVIEKANLATKRAGNKSLLGIRLYAKDGLNISFGTDEKPSYYYQLSDNTKFLFAYYLYEETQDIRSAILLFDEPDKGFHPTAQGDILRFLKSLAAKGNLVVIATHSQHMIDPTLLLGVRLMSIDSDKRLAVKNDIHNPSKKKGEDLALQPVLDNIGFSYSRQIAFKDHVIVTEGFTDMIYLQAFNAILGNKKDLDIAPARSASHILHILPFLISQDIAIKIVLDVGDVKAQIQKDFHVGDEFIYEVPAPPGATAKTSGIEDLFSKDDFKGILLDAGHPLKSNFDRVTNSVYVTQHTRNKEHAAVKWLVANYFGQSASKYKKDDFQQETRDRFADVFKFCADGKWFRV